VKRVLVVASDESFRRRMRELLGALPGARLEGEAVDGIGAAIVGALGRPDVVVMDAELPPTEARDIVQRIRAVRPRTRIVTCSTAEPAGLATATVDVAAAVADESPQHQADPLHERA
jgi:chemotaxis response regulator CheB